MCANGAVRPTTTIRIAGLGGEPGLTARIKERVGGLVGRLVLGGTADQVCHRTVLPVMVLWGGAAA
ncbi:MAG: hypothetical protein HY728_00075 [Candidatus Rokubacteria bacterium]|nr:hypothetical protein [Candidatus Rokubacteria bacterium]